MKTFQQNVSNRGGDGDGVGNGCGCDGRHVGHGVDVEQSCYVNLCWLRDFLEEGTLDFTPLDPVVC